MNYLLALLSSLCLFGCCSTNCVTSPNLTPYKESNYNFFNDGRGPILKEFNKTLESALSGNNKSLTRILSWTSLTIGEETTKYGIFLRKLQKNVGEPRIINAYDSLSPLEQESVKHTMLRAY